MKVRRTLTPLEVLRLAKPALLPEVQKRGISGRSKADGLGKALVCLQVGWMIVQPLARVASRLPIALLEPHTVSHVVCSAILYVMCWYKPHNLDEPFKIPVTGSVSTVLKGPWEELEVLEEQIPDALRRKQRH